VTSNLPKRVWEHREGVVEGFTKEYGVKTLVGYEVHDNAESAITREKQLKKWSRIWKLTLIEEKTPEWRDLYQEIANDVAHPPGGLDSRLRGMTNLSRE
jgi:putative endonuclease